MVKSYFVDRRLPLCYVFPKGGSVVDFTGAYSRTAFARFLLPLMAAELFQQIYGLINTAVVSWALDDTALAVMGACSGLLDVRGKVLAGMFYGFGISLGRAVGSGAPGRLPAAFSAALRYTLALSALGVLAALGVNGLMVLGNIPPQLRPAAAPYLMLSFAGAGAVAAKLLLVVLLQAVGDTGYFSALAVLGTLVNTALVVLFIGVLHGGVACAALATVLTNGLLALLLLGHLRRKWPNLLQTAPGREIPGATWWNLMENGGAKTIYFFLGTLGTLVLQRGINTLAPQLIAAQALALSLQSLLIAPQGELGTASAVITGQNVGAGNRRNILAYHRRLVRLFVALGGGMVVLIWLAGQPLVQLVAGPDKSPAVTGPALDWLRITVLIFPFSFAILYRNALQALEQYGGVVLLGILEVVCSAVCAWVLIPQLGFFGGALGVVLSWGASALLGCVLFRRAMKGGGACAD